MSPPLAADDLDRLKGRIAALRAKTVGNGCTEEEALAAAAKAAELMDRHDLSLSDIDLGRSPCEQLAYRTARKKRMPIEDCVGAVAAFCDCRVWRERDADGGARSVFFGLRSDVTVAHDLTQVLRATKPRHHRKAATRQSIPQTRQNRPKPDRLHLCLTFPGQPCGSGKDRRGVGMERIAVSSPDHGPTRPRPLFCDVCER